MNWKWKYLSVLTAVSLTMCAPIFGPVEVSTGSGTGSGGYEAVFGTSAGVTSGGCLRAEALSNTAGVTCTGTDFRIVTHPLAVHTGETPKITRFSCIVTQAATGFDPGETWTLTPIWTQGDGAGALNATDSTTTIVCDDGECEELYDVISTNTESTSPYSGPQALRIRQDKVTTFNTPAITCQIRLEII